MPVIRKVNFKSTQFFILIESCALGLTSWIFSPLYKNYTHLFALLFPPVFLHWEKIKILFQLDKVGTKFSVLVANIYIDKVSDMNTLVDSL